MNELTRLPFLLCLDLEAGSDRLVRWAAQLARRCGQPVQVLYVSPGSLSVERRHRKKQRLQDLVAEPFQDLEITIMDPREGIAEEVIVEVARQIDAGVILLGRRQRTAVERIYVGSTTSAVISLARRPVLVVPVSEQP